MNDEQPDHRNSSPSCGFVSFPVADVLREDDRNDNVTGRHPNGTHNQNWLSSELINVKNGGHGRQPHGDADNTCVSSKLEMTNLGIEVGRHTGSKKRSSRTRESQALEDRWRVVENSVNSCPLLEKHSNRCKHDAAEHWHRREK